jgi:hypothetical protein
LGLGSENLRGGTWNNHRNNARCANRNRNNPDNFNNNVGFRVLSHDSQVKPVNLVAYAVRDGAILRASVTQSRLARSAKYQILTASSGSRAFTRGES